MSRLNLDFRGVNIPARNPNALTTNVFTQYGDNLRKEHGRVQRLQTDIGMNDARLASAAEMQRKRLAAQAANQEANRAARLAQNEIVNARNKTIADAQLKEYTQTQERIAAETKVQENTVLGISAMPTHTTGKAMPDTKEGVIALQKEIKEAGITAGEGVNISDKGTNELTAINDKLTTANAKVAELTPRTEEDFVVEYKKGKALLDQRKAIDPDYTRKMRTKDLDALKSIRAKGVNNLVDDAPGFWSSDRDKVIYSNKKKKEAKDLETAKKASVKLQEELDNRGIEEASKVSLEAAKASNKAKRDIEDTYKKPLTSKEAKAAARTQLKTRLAKGNFTPAERKAEIDGLAKRLLKVDESESVKLAEKQRRDMKKADLDMEYKYKAKELTLKASLRSKKYTPDTYNKRAQQDDRAMINYIDKNWGVWDQADDDSLEYSAARMRLEEAGLTGTLMYPKGAAI